MLAPVQTYPAFKSFVTAFRDWVRHRRLISQCNARLAACDDSEIERIAHDVGVSANDLRNMAKRGPDAAEQLLERMAALHLDANAIARNRPATMRDLQRLCTNCIDKKRCQRDLVLTPNSPIWHHYCPNADTLDELQRETANDR